MLQHYPTGKAAATVCQCADGKAVDLRMQAAARMCLMCMCHFGETCNNNITKLWAVQMAG